MPETIGDRLVNTIRAHLAENGWKSLGQMKEPAETIKKLADALFEAELAALKPKRRPRATLIPPTPEEVSEYARTLGFELDGQYFCDHYGRVGWKLGGGLKMTDWKATVRIWQRKRFDDGPPPTTGKQASLGALQMQLTKVERELDDILRPGGCAHTIPPTGAKMERYTELMGRRKELLAKIDEFGA